MLTYVSLPTIMEPWISWPQQSKLLKLGWIRLAAVSDGLVFDEEGMDEEGFLGL